MATRLNNASPSRNLFGVSSKRMRSHCVPKVFIEGPSFISSALTPAGTVRIPQMIGPGSTFRTPRTVEYRPRGLPHWGPSHAPRRTLGSNAPLTVTDLAMKVCGGAAFRKELGVERRFRDARAARVMAPTTDALLDFIGRATLGLPLFDEAVAR